SSPAAMASAIALLMRRSARSTGAPNGHTGWGPGTVHGCNCQRLLATSCPMWTRRCVSGKSGNGQPPTDDHRLGDLPLGYELVNHLLDPGVARGAVVVERDDGVGGEVRPPGVPVRQTTVV